MSEKQDKLIELAGYVLASSYRHRVLIALGNKTKTPSTIARNSGLHLNHISNVLTSLKKNGLVICLNESAKKGRLYQVTELGHDVIKTIKFDMN